MGQKYIIELEDESFMDGSAHVLHRVKGFRSLVFDEEGLAKLTPYEPGTKPEPAFKVGDEVAYPAIDEYRKCVVLAEAEEPGVWVVLTENGCVEYMDERLDERFLKKTGKHYPEVTKMIEALRGDAHATD